MPVKKISDIKSGQRVFRIWGYPVRPENSHNNDVSVIDGNHYHIRVEVCLPIGKRSHDYFKWDGYDKKRIGHLIDGSVLSRYFHKKTRAEQYKQEILQGHHPLALIEMEEHAANCDALDENMKAWGMCDDDYYDECY